MPMVRKRDSIYFQLFQLLILAALVSGLFFLVTNWAGDSLLNWFYISSNYEEKKNGEYIGKLQEYVSQNQLSTEDTKELTEWVRRQRVVALQLYKNGILMYDSEYPDQDMEAEQIEAGDYEWTVYYPCLLYTSRGSGFGAGGRHRKTGSCHRRRPGRNQRSLLSAAYGT